MLQQNTAAFYLVSLGAPFKIAMMNPEETVGWGRRGGNRPRIRRQICRNPTIYPSGSAARKGKLRIGTVENGRLAI
jgi:hypothetical protein